MLCGEPLVLCRILHMAWPEIPLVSYYSQSVTPYTRHGVQRQRFLDDFYAMVTTLPHVFFVTSQ